MLDFLYSIDVAVFYFINNSLANPVTDKIMPFITNENSWILVYIFFWFILLFKGGKHRVIIAIFILLMITFSDQLSSVHLKIWLGRIRPCNVLPDVHLLVSCTNSYSFPSSHAVNNFAAAIFVSYFYKNLKWPLFSIAFIVSLSRIFVGVHYPSDIIGGAILGLIIGYIFAKLTDLFINFFEKNKETIYHKLRRK